MSISYRLQAEAVDVTAAEYRDHLASLKLKPVGRGGIDPAAISLKGMRIDVLRAAARTLHGLADRDDARQGTREPDRAQETGGRR